MIVSSKSIRPEVITGLDIFVKKEGVETDVDFVEENCIPVDPHVNLRVSKYPAWSAILRMAQSRLSFLRCFWSRWTT
jgi:hypothetical protein